MPNRHGAYGRLYDEVKTFECIWVKALSQLRQIVCVFPFSSAEICSARFNRAYFEFISQYFFFLFSFPLRKPNTSSMYESGRCAAKNCEWASKRKKNEKNTKQLTNSMDCRALHIKKAKVEKWVEKRNKAPLSYNCLIYLCTKRLVTLLWIPSLRIHLYIFSARFNAKGFHFVDVVVVGWLSSVDRRRRPSTLCVTVYRTAWWVHVLLAFALNGRHSDVIGATLLSAEDCDLREITKGISKHIIACRREFQWHFFSFVRSFVPFAKRHWEPARWLGAHVLFTLEALLLCQSVLNQLEVMNLWAIETAEKANPKNIFASGEIVWWQSLKSFSM